ncbi:MAG: hypothetical protein ACOYB2_11165 [Limnohabitans sp.]
MNENDRAVLDAWTAEQDEIVRARAESDPALAGKPDAMIFARMLIENDERDGVVRKLMAADPLLPVGSAFTIASDLASVERSKEWVNRGMSAETALPFVGSYGRLEFVLWAVDNGHMAENDLLDMLPDLWRGADPDDTDTRFLELWQKAWIRNGKRPVRDGKHLPKGHTLRVFRGQDKDARWASPGRWTSGSPRSSRPGPARASRLGTGSCSRA